MSFARIMQLAELGVLLAVFGNLIGIMYLLYRYIVSLILWGYNHYGHDGTERATAGTPQSKSSKSSPLPKP
jgi:hypothetical protein